MAKILIVEDDKRTNMAICEYLKPTGHNIVSAYDGEEVVLCQDLVQVKMRFSSS